MFKQGTFTIATGSKVHPVWGHVFADRDLKEGEIQIQHGIIYPCKEEQSGFKVRLPEKDEPTCASPRAWTAEVPRLWVKRSRDPEVVPIYVVAYVTRLDLPLAQWRRQLTARREHRSPYWTSAKLVGTASEPRFEQWPPESFRIWLEGKDVGILHAWEPVLDDEHFALAPQVAPIIPEHPPDSAKKERLGTTYELWFSYALEHLPVEDLRFSKPKPGTVSTVNDILCGQASNQRKTSKCAIAACSYYRAPQPWALGAVK